MTTTPEEAKQRLQRALKYFWELEPSKWGHPAVGINPVIKKQHTEFLRLLDVVLNGRHTVTTPDVRIEPPAGYVPVQVKPKEIDAFPLDKTGLK